MMNERQMLRAFDSAVESGATDRLFWAAQAALRYVSEAEGGPWFMNQLAERLPAWRAARSRLNAADGRLDTEGDQAIKSLTLLLEGGPVGMIGRRQLPAIEPAADEAEAQALADYLGDEDRLREFRGVLALPTEPEPVLVVGAIEFQAPPLIRTYHEGLIERPWGERPWRAEPALIEDAVLMAFAIGELHDAKRTLDVVHRIEPHLRELVEIDAWGAGANGFGHLLRSGLVEPTGVGTYRASSQGARVVAVHLMPAWGEAQSGLMSDFL